MHLRRQDAVVKFPYHRDLWSEIYEEMDGTPAAYHSRIPPSTWLTFAQEG